MQCRKCGLDIPDGSAYCNHCGARQTLEPAKSRMKQRGNGQGTVIKRGKTYTAVITQYVGDKRVTKTKGGFSRRRDAIDYIPTLKNAKKTAPDITFSALYEKFIELHAQRVSRDTIYCYKSAYAYFAPLYFMSFSEITTELFQQCIDNCGHGRRTRENMKALGTLMSKYAMQLDLVDKDFAQYVYIRKGEEREREPFTPQEVEKMFAVVGTVPYIDRDCAVH